MIRHPLSRALRLERGNPKPLVVFVGAGGKTSAMFALAAELADRGWRVVTATTTRLFAAQQADSVAWCDVQRLDQLSAALDAHGQALVSPRHEGETVPGLTPADVRSLYERDDVDAVLVEADGSRGRLFKAPAPHEPVIPGDATHVVVLVGAGVFGLPVVDAHVHRPERVAALGGVPLGSVVTPDLVVRVLASPEGGLAGVPGGASFLPFLTGLTDVADRLQSEQAARQLLTHRRVTEVLLGSLPAVGSETRHSNPAIHRRSRTAAVVLAAGQATRFGETKQLLRWRGRTLVEHAVQAALDLCETVVVVVGHEAEAVAGAVEHLPVEVIFNAKHATGQGSSVALGAETLLEASRPFIGEAFFLPADQPGVTGELLDALREARGLRYIAVPHHEGQRGAPVLFDRALLHQLTTLKGDVGGRALFDAHAEEIAWLEVPDPSVLADVDTPRAWRRFLAGNPL